MLGTRRGKNHTFAKTKIKMSKQTHIDHTKSIFCFFAIALKEKRKSKRTNGTFAFAPTHNAALQQKQKSHFLPTHQLTA